MDQLPWFLFLNFDKKAIERRKMTKLEIIQKTAQHVVSAISSAIGVDVAMFDQDFKVIATSKTFFNKRGRKANKNYLKGVFKRDVVIVSNPGFNELCKGCECEGNCPETAEVDRTIRYNDQIIGVITMTTYTQAGKEKLLNNTSELLEFLGEMANLLCNEIKLNETLEKETVVKRHLETTVNFINDGIITIDEKGKINQINDQAANILRINKKLSLGRQLQNFLPFNYVSPIINEKKPIRGQEILISTPRNIHCLLSGNPVEVDGKSVGAVISVKDFKEVRTDIYQLAHEQIKYDFKDIIGESDTIQKIIEYAKQIASTDSSILIQGESGTGKELFARAIHNYGRRKDGPFIPINCAAIPESLLESELFGYDEGAFSGARKGGKPGKFELASDGTIFLDEIGEMPLHMQAKLLRVLQKGAIERVGGILSFSLNVRIIAATNQDLQRMVKKATFREDLYFRLNVMPLFVPPLRDRKHDIPILAKFFLQKYNEITKNEFKGFTDETIGLMQQYDWPGNVRELENAIQYAVNIEKENIIRPLSLPSNITEHIQTFSNKLTLKDKVLGFEKQLLLKALDSHGHSVDAKIMIANDFGVSLPTLYRKLKNHSL